MQQRYYDPTLGRFLSIDPSHADPTAPVTLNRYAYANNNPYKYTDPDGEFAFLIPVAIFIAKEIAAELASEATGGLTDFLSFRRLATTVGKKGAALAKNALKSKKTKSGVNCSFDAKTLVKVSDGYMPIIDIEPGVHEVWSKSEATGEIKLQPVMDTFVADYDTSVTLTVFNTKDNIVSRIKSNEIHPYYVLKSTPQLGAAMPTVQSESSVTSPIEAATTGEWVEAGRISVGDLLMDIDGRWQEVTTVSIDEESLRAYNIDVANFDTYFVTDSASAAADLWVHNQGCGGGKGEFNLNSKQLGKKLGKHVGDFGGNPSNPADRKRVTDLINDIGINPDKTTTGTFAGLGANGARGPAQFRIKGSDVVVTKPDGSFVTILKDGINSTSVKNSLGGG